MGCQGYYKAAACVRRVGAFGVGQQIMHAVSAHTGMKWMRPIAPQPNGTRTAIFECERVPPVFLLDLPVVVHTRAEPEQCSRQSCGILKNYSPLPPETNKLINECMEVVDVAIARI